MSVTRLDKFVIRAMRKKMKLISDCGDSVSKECKRCFGGVYRAAWWSLRVAGVWSQAVGFALLRLVGICLQSP
jgi:hypothetical protein